MPRRGRWSAIRRCLAASSQRGRDTPVYRCVFVYVGVGCRLVYVYVCASAIDGWVWVNTNRSHPPNPQHPPLTSSHSHTSRPSSGSQRYTLGKAAGRCCGGLCGVVWCGVVYIWWWGVLNSIYISIYQPVHTYISIYTMYTNTQTDIPATSPGCPRRRTKRARGRGGPIPRIRGRSLLCMWVGVGRERGGGVTCVGVWVWVSVFVFYFLF